MNCFACDRKIGKVMTAVDTGDAQVVLVGPDCAKAVKASGKKGYQPPRGGPRLYAGTFGPDGTLIDSLAPMPSIGHKIFPLHGAAKPHELLKKV